MRYTLPLLAGATYAVLEVTYTKKGQIYTSMILIPTVQRTVYTAG